MKYRGKEYKTMGDTFKLALKLAKKDPYEAKEWFYEYVNYISFENKYSWDKSIEIAKSNLKYFAGYYDNETCKIINNVYSDL